MAGELLRKQVSSDLAQTLPDFDASTTGILSTVEDDQIAEIQTALSRAADEEQAFVLLGQSAGPGALGSNPLEAGKQLFMRYQHKIIPLICGHPVLKAYCTRRSVIDTTTVATLIAGILLQHQLGPWNIPAISCLLVRVGVSELCHAEWNKT